MAIFYRWMLFKKAVFTNIQEVVEMSTYVEIETRKIALQKTEKGVAQCVVLTGRVMATDLVSIRLRVKRYLIICFCDNVHPCLCAGSAQGSHEAH